MPLDARALLLSQHATVHDVLAEVLSDCPPEILHRPPPGEMGNSIAATYVHVAFSEDRWLHQNCFDRPPLFRNGDWAARTGIEMPDERRMTRDWALNLRIPNIAVFAEYVAAVRAATASFVADGSDEALMRVVKTPLGAGPALHDMARMGVFHCAVHAGEISAMKGAAGLKGLPF